MPPLYWATALAIATYLLDHRPSSFVYDVITFKLLHHKSPKYSFVILPTLHGIHLHGVFVITIGQCHNRTTHPILIFISTMTHL